MTVPVRAVVITKDRQWIRQTGPGMTRIAGSKCDLQVVPFGAGGLMAIEVVNHEPFPGGYLLDFVGYEGPTRIEPKFHTITGSRAIYHEQGLAGWCLADVTDALKTGETDVVVPGQRRLSFVVGPISELWEKVPTDANKLEVLSAFMDLGGISPADVECGNDLWDHGWSTWSGDPSTSLNPFNATQDLLGYMHAGWRPGVKVGWGNPLLWGGTYCNSAPDAGNNCTYEFELLCLLVSTMPFFADNARRQIAFEVGLAAARRKASMGLVRASIVDGTDGRLTGMSGYERTLRRSSDPPTYIPGGNKRPMTSHDPSAGLQFWAFMCPNDPTLATAAEEIRARLLRQPFTDSGGVWIRYGSRPCGWHLSGLRAAYLITGDSRYRLRAQEFVDWMDATMPLAGLHWETPGNGAGTAGPYRDQEVIYQALMWRGLGLSIPASWADRSRKVFLTVLTESLDFPYHVHADGHNQMFLGTSFCGFTLAPWIKLAEMPENASMRSKLVRLFDRFTAERFPDGVDTHWRSRGDTTFMKKVPQQYRTIMPRHVRLIESWRS